MTLFFSKSQSFREIVFFSAKPDANGVRSQESPHQSSSSSQGQSSKTDTGSIQALEDSPGFQADRPGSESARTKKGLQTLALQLTDMANRKNLFSQILRNEDIEVGNIA